jgi:hypothetical protein
MVQILSVELKTPVGLVRAHSKQQNAKLCEEAIFDP